MSKTSDPWPLQQAALLQLAHVVEESLAGIVGAREHDGMQAIEGTLMPLTRSMERAQPGNPDSSQRSAHGVLPSVLQGR